MADDARTTSRRSSLPPITIERVNICRDSAAFWSEKLPQFANSMQQRADNYAITAALLSALTGLSVWATLSSATEWWAQAAVAVVAFAAAAVGIIPRIKNYGEAAGKARELSTAYGKILGELTDVVPWTGPAAHDPTIRHVIDAFEDLKGRKDALGPRIRKLQDERDNQKKGGIRAADCAA